jgi:hypothetical protein
VGAWGMGDIPGAPAGRHALGYNLPLK